MGRNLDVRAINKTPLEAFTGDQVVTRDLLGSTLRHAPVHTTLVGQNVDLIACILNRNWDFFDRCLLNQNLSADRLIVRLNRNFANLSR